MAFINWEDSFSVKIPEFDDAHKKLLGMINDLHDAMKLGKGKDVACKLLNDLYDYTSEHFVQEEAFMKKHNYAGLAEQEDQHKMFVEKIALIKKDCETGKFTVSIDLMDFLKNWLLVHIKETDMRYSAVLAGKPF